MARPGYVKKTNEDNQWDAVTWCMFHPKDIPMARENLASRERGFDNEGVRQLMAAMCLKACVDYKRTISSRIIKESSIGQRTLKECREFFAGDIFQFFTNGMPVDEIEQHIREAPDVSIERMFKNALTNRGKLREKEDED